jgi:cysteinyl-tRNA synthetase
LEKFSELVKSTISGNEINQDKLNEIVFWEREFLQLGLLPEIPAEITDLGTERMQAKRERDFQKSDELRDEITKKGYQIDDYPWGYGIWKKL